LKASQEEKNKPKLLELFAGSRDISKIADGLGFETFSIDIEPFDGIDLVADILDVEASDVPFTPDMVWASFDCTTYSIAAVSTHREDRIIPKSDYARKCDAVNIHSISLINQWVELNPEMVFFIENPRGMLRHMPFMQEFKRETVWYCQYGDERAKPTDIWTNSKTWEPRPQCKNYKYDADGNIINRHCHHHAARRGAKTGTQGRKGSYNRSLVPKALHAEILISAMNNKGA